MRLKPKTDPARCEVTVTNTPEPWVLPYKETPLAVMDTHDDVIQGRPEDATPSSDVAPWIFDEFERMRIYLNLPKFPLQVKTRKSKRYNGFVSGAVYYEEDVPTLMILRLCPNSDKAEVLATMVHEFAHTIDFEADHDQVFKDNLIELAKGLWGDAYFERAHEASQGSYTTVDLWVSVGIRHALSGAPEPSRATLDGDDDIAMARVVSKIQKLQRLARNQPGTPEAILACATANTMIARYDLGSYQMILPDQDVSDEMADLWVSVGKRQRWSRYLAVAVADYCQVFALSHKSLGLMHFFGRWADVQRASFLTGSLISRLKKQADQHIEELRERRKFQRGDARAFRQAFLMTATMTLTQRLTTEAELEQRSPEAHAMAVSDMTRAKAFASALFEDRKLQWGESKGNPIRYTRSAAGARAGQDITINEGLSAEDGPKALTTEGIPYDDKNSSLD